MKIKKLRKPTIVLCFSVIMLFLGSCRSHSHFVVNVNTWGNYNLNGKTFYLESGNEGVSSNDLEFIEYAKYLHENLKNQGATRAINKQNADVRIVMTYDITDKSHNEAVRKPRYDSEGTIIGYEYVQDNVSEFERVVEVCAYDNRSKESGPIMLWKTNLKSSGWSSNLREVIPFMIYSGKDKFGKDTSGWLEYTIYSNDNAFLKWKENALSNSNY